MDPKNEARLEHAKEFAAWQSDQAFQDRPHDIDAYEDALRSDENWRNAEIVARLRDAIHAQATDIFLGGLARELLDGAQ